MWDDYTITDKVSHKKDTSLEKRKIKKNYRVKQRIFSRETERRNKGMDKEILVEYAEAKQEIKDLRRRIEEDQQALKRLNETVIADVVSCGRKGKKSLGTVKIEGKPTMAIARRLAAYKKRIAQMELLETDLLEKQTEVEEYIEQIEKSEMRMIFRFYFIDDLSYIKVAERMNAAFPKRNVVYTDENIKKRMQRFLKK